jgi:transcriptional repressor NF-X1
VPPAKRSFVISLAGAYRLSTELVDAEPNRSVLVRRRVDTRIPHPLLSAAVAQAQAQAQAAKPALGGLGNLRASAAPGPGAWGRAGATATAMATATATARAGSQLPTPSVSAAVTPVGGSTPVMAARTLSRPITSAPPSASASVVQEGSRAVHGQVGQVEDDDWDVDVGAEGANK